MLHKIIFSIFITVYLLNSLTSHVYAAGCSSFTAYSTDAQAAVAESSCRAANKFPSRYSLTDSGSAQCKSDSRQQDGHYVVCCDSPIEANAEDSVKQPLCGSSAELGEGNSVCWGCGGYFYCAGGSSALAGSEPELEAHRNEGFYQLNEQEFNAIKSRGGSFIYNGLSYKLDQNIVSIGICGSNVKACLTPNFNSCTNLATDQNAPQSTIYPKPTPLTPQAFNAAKQTQERLLKAKPGKPMNIVTTINNITAGQPVVLQSIGLKFLGAFGGGSIVNSISRNYFAKIRYADNSHMMSNLIPFAQKFKLFSSQYMADIKSQAQSSMPYEDGKLEQNLMPWDTGWRFCVLDGLITRWDGTKANNTPLRGLTKSLKYIGQNNPLNPWYWYDAVVYTAWSTTFNTPARTPSTNFNTPSADLVPVKATSDGDDVFFDTKGQESRLDALLPRGCSEVGKGNKYYQAKTTAAGKAVTDGSGSGANDSGSASIFSVTIDFLSSVWKPKLTPCTNDETNTDGCANAGPYVVPGDIAIGQGALVSHTQGYVASDIQAAGAPAEDRDNLLREGGNHPKGKYPGGYYNAGFDIKTQKKVRKFYNAEADQLQTINSGTSDSSGGKPAPRNSYPAQIKSMIDTDQCEQKKLLDIRYSRRNNVICPQIDNQEPYDTTPDRPIAVWQGAPNPLPASFNPTAVFSGDVKKAIELATNGEIPACVLEAVKYIETGSQTNFSGECKINACSAAGPFQITVGVDSTGDSHCRMCGGNNPESSWINGERDCPNGWAATGSNWPKVPTDPSPCDMDLAAKRAVEMLQKKAEYRCETLDNRPASQQREAIITAGNSYYGSSRNEPRLDNCSYGEFVYKHCDGSYVCGTANVDLQQKYEQCQNQRNL